MPVLLLLRLSQKDKTYGGIQIKFILKWVFLNNTFWVQVVNELTYYCRYSTTKSHCTPHSSRENTPTLLLIVVFLLNIDGSTVSEITNRLSKASERDKQDTHIPVPLLFLTTHKGVAGSLKFYSVLVVPDRDRHHSQTCFCIMLWITKSTPWQLLEFDE